MGWLLIILGGLVAVAWLAAASRLLFADRPRGRARCPRCFYVLSETPEAPPPQTCPECSHAWTDPATLARTRRHYKRFAAASLLALLLVSGLLFSNFARKKGWGALPDPVVARLVGLRIDTLDEHVRTRIRRGYFDESESTPVLSRALTMVRSTDPDTRDEGFSFLEALHRNAYYLVNDREKAERPRLVDLDPAATASTLIDLYPSLQESDQIRAIKLLSQVRHHDDRSLVMLLRESLSASPSMQEEALQSLSSQWQLREGEHRQPGPSNALPRAGGWSRDDTLTVHSACVSAVLETVKNERLTPATIEVGLSLAEQGRATIIDRLSPDSQANFDAAQFQKRVSAGLIDRPHEMARAFGLWIACTSEGPTNRCFEWITKYADDEAGPVRSIAIECTQLFDYSPRTEALLAAAILDPRDDQSTAYVAYHIAAQYGQQAHGLVDELHTYAASTERRAWSSSFAEDFLAIGGDPREMIRSIRERIDGYLELESSGNGSVVYYMGDGHPLSTDFESIAELGRGLPEEADFLVEHVNADRVQIAAPAAYAHALIAGPSELSTRAILRFNPDLSQSLMSNSRQFYLAQMIWENAVVPEVLVEHVLDPKKPERVDAFVDFCSQYGVYMKTWAPYEPILRAGLESDSPAVVDSVHTLIDNHLSADDD